MIVLRSRRSDALAGANAVSQSSVAGHFFLTVPISIDVRIDTLAGEFIKIFDFCFEICP